VSLQLAEDAVCVWQARLDAGADRLDGYGHVLSQDEHARAKRFVFDRDRRRFIVARAALRQVLAAYLEVAPEQLEFDYGERGKPALRGSRGADWLRFNVAHSDELALIGVARGLTLGVDVEYARPLPDALSIAEHYFTPAEKAVLRAADGVAQQRVFFTYWTRKEAVLKATGDGLSLPLDQVNVEWTSTAESESTHCLEVLDLAGVSHTLRVVDLVPADGYLGALAVGSQRVQIEHREWPANLESRT
jgi:4'-phosphopantetheinyl transferase